MFCRTLFLLGISVLASNATARQTSHEATELTVEQCDAGKAQTQYELTRCAGMYAQLQDKILSQLVQELHSHLDPRASASMDSVQVEWKRYREAHCAWVASFFEGGSIAPMENLDCETELTTDRIKELKVYLCEGAGLSGYCPESRKYDPPESTDE